MSKWLHRLRTICAEVAELKVLLSKNDLDRFTDFSNELIEALEVKYSTALDLKQAAYRSILRDAVHDILLKDGVISRERVDPSVGMKEGFRPYIDAYKKECAQARDYIRKLKDLVADLNNLELTEVQNFLEKLYQRFNAVAERSFRLSVSIFSSDYHEQLFGIRLYDGVRFLHEEGR